MVDIKKTLLVVSGIMTGVMMALTYLLITYNIATNHLPYTMESYSFFNPALIGLTVTLALAVGLFLIFGKKRSSFRISFLVSVTISSLIVFVILSYIRYYF